MSVFARFAALSVLAAVLVPVGSAAGSPRAEVTCFGRTPTLIGTNGADTLTGTADSDVIVGLDGDDTIDGGGGDDLICAGAGNDTVSGAAGADRIAGQGGRDALTGDGGKDRLVGGGGKDSLVGGSQRDLTVGGGGIDRCDGEVARACEGAGSGRLTNPPLVTMYFDEGVGVDDREAITAGVGIAHNYLATILGGDEAATWTDSVGNPLTFSVFASSDDEGCCLARSIGPSGVYEMGPRFYVEHPLWTQGNDFFIWHRKHAAHEYAHVWQAAVGGWGRGQPNIGNPLGRWLSEGMAEYLAHNSLIEIGLLTEEQVIADTVRGASTAGFSPDLAAWENPDDQTFASVGYGFSLLAVIRLVNEYGGPMVLRLISEEAGRLAIATPGVRDYLHMGMAFENLGIDRGAFYADMAEYFDQLVALQFAATETVPDYFSKFLVNPSEPVNPPFETAGPMSTTTTTTFDSSVCRGDGPEVAGSRLECLGSVSGQVLTYAFRIVGFQVAGQAEGVMDMVDARSNCGRQAWGRFEQENGQIMWVRVQGGTSCTIELHLPSGTVTSQVDATASP